MLDKNQQDLLTLALYEANSSNNSHNLDESLMNFYISSKFKDDFMVESGQKNSGKN